MTEKIERSFYLNKNELGLLLDSKQKSSLYCLSIFGSDVTISDRSAYMSLYSMVQGGLISVEDDSFALADDLDGVIVAMAQAEKAIAVFSPHAAGIAVYKNGSQLILTEQEAHREESIKITPVAPDSLGDIITGRFSLNINETVPGGENVGAATDDMYFTSLMLLNLNDDFSELNTSQRTVLAVDFVDLKEERLYKKLAVIRLGIGLATVLWSSDGVKTMPYEKAGLERILKDNFTEV